jgi:hypothetical protein
MLQGVTDSGQILTSLRVGGKPKKFIGHTPVLERAGIQIAPGGGRACPGAWTPAAARLDAWTPAWALSWHIPGRSLALPGRYPGGRQGATGGLAASQECCNFCGVNGWGILLFNFRGEISLAPESLQQLT